MRPLSVVSACAALGVATVAYATASSEPMGNMNMPGLAMPMPGESPAQPGRQAYTSNHAFLIKLRSFPRPVPFEKYFAVQFAVYDGRNPGKGLIDAHLTVTAGMRHGVSEGFAHGMQSTPRILAKGDLFTVSGLYFHMAGPWTLKVDVERKGQTGTAYFTLPCCAQ